MKKILIIICFFAFLGYVKAKDNTLYFTEFGHKLVYDSSFDKEEFMSHLSIVPGQTNTDVLIIKNGTSTEYELFLKVKYLDDDSKVKALIENIDMKVYLDDELIYTGKVSGEEYNNSGVKLTNAFSLGIFKSNSAVLKVETTLNPEFTDVDNDAIAKIDWEFYAAYEEEIINIVENPYTADTTFTIVKILIGLLIILGSISLLIIKKSRKEESV